MCARRPIGAMVCVNDIESAKSIVDLKTSITKAKLQTTCKFLDSEIASGL